MALPTDGNAALNNPSHFTEHQRVSDALALLVSTPWVAIPFSAGWSTYPGFEQCAYRKVGDVVQLQGLAQAPSGTTTMTTLPVGYRPKRTHLFTVGFNGNAVQRIDVNPDGTITATTATSGWLTLSGLTFSTIGL